MEKFSDGIPMDFIERLEELRKERALTRKQLLENCHLWKNKISYKILTEREKAQSPPQEPTQLTLEQEADAFAAKAREQFLLEKKRESQASSVKKSDVG